MYQYRNYEVKRGNKYFIIREDSEYAEYRVFIKEVEELEIDACPEEIAIVIALLRRIKRETKAPGLARRGKMVDIVGHESFPEILNRIIQKKQFEEFMAILPELKQYEAEEIFLLGMITEYLD